MMFGIFSLHFSKLELKKNSLQKIEVQDLIKD